jgi:hypothetical protein
MGRISKYEIVRTEDIFSDEEIMDLRINESYIDKMFQSLETQNSLLAKMLLIRNSMDCELCRRRAKYVKRKIVPEGSILTCTRPCNFTKNIRGGSIFKGCRLKMQAIFKILYRYK